MRVVIGSAFLLLLGGCASTPPQSGFLSSYEGLTARSGAVRTGVKERKMGAPPPSRVAIEPARFATPTTGAWMTEGERTALLREVDAQLCFEISERYDVVVGPAATSATDVRIRSAVTEVAPTGRFGSASSAAANFFIPGPIGLRLPAGLGGLAVESELISPAGEQLAAISWRRSATAVGTDTPSLSRIGDALQFAEPFADHTAKVMTLGGAKGRPVPKPDPCAAFGPRFRPEGWLAKFATGLYVPQASAAKRE